MRITRRLEFDSGHRIPDHQSQCRHLHGHRYAIEITLAGEIIRQTGSPLNGMVMDFSDIKNVVSTWIDEHLDHRMILHRDDPILPTLRSMNEPVHVIDVNPTAENIARVIFDFTQSRGFPVTEVRLWETDSCFATYQPP